jgi:hypothetical protein
LTDASLKADRLAIRDALAGCGKTSADNVLRV